MIYPVKVFDASNNLKQIISSATLVEKMYSGFAVPDSIGVGKKAFTVIKKCRLCKEDFEAYDARMLFCIKPGVKAYDQCRSKHERSKRGYKKMVFPKANCGHCKKEFQPNRKGHLLCGDPCNHSIVNREVRALVKHTCKRCSSEFSTTTRNKVIFCGKPCTWAMHRAEEQQASVFNQYKDQECLLCHKLFDSTRKRRVCHNPCKMSSSAHRRLTKGAQ